PVQIPAIASKFQLEIVQVLQEGLKAPTPEKPHVSQHCAALLRTIILQIKPEASLEFCNTMQVFIENFFKSPTLYQDLQLSTEVFCSCTLAIQKKLYQGKYQILIETINCFSGMNFNNEQRTTTLSAVFTGIMQDKEFDMFWSRDTF